MADDGTLINRSIPAIAELAAIPHWVLWKAERRGNGKDTKVPYQVGGRFKASSTKPNTWDNFDCCWEFAFVHRAADGIGFVVTKDSGICAADLNSCLEPDGLASAWARIVLDKLNSYTEISPSGNGLRVFFRGTLPKQGLRAGKLELYAAERFLTVTGQHFTGTPDELRDVPVSITTELTHAAEAKRATQNGQSGPIHEIVVDVSGARPVPHSTIAELRRDDAFRRIWDKADKPANDETHSGYMVSIARRCAMKGLDDQTIADVLVEFNRVSGRDDKSNIRQISRSIGLVRATQHDEPDWMTHLAHNSQGKIVKHISNIAAALRLCPEWDSVLGWNNFKHVVTYHKKPPWSHGRPISPPCEWDADVDPVYLCEWMAHRGLVIEHGTCGHAMVASAQEHCFDPLTTWLDGLKWDGVERLQNVPVDHFGVIEEDQPLAGTYFRKWMLGAVRRAYQPGCKVDTMLVLRGEQGARKSLALQAIGGQWALPNLPSIRDKDALLALQGSWIVLTEEFQGFATGPSGWSQIKEFVSRTHDSFRAPYGRGWKLYPRRCVFAASVNRDWAVEDATGARRFWMIDCPNGKLDVKGLRECRDQLVAEAVHAIKDSERWWLTPDEETQSHTFETAHVMFEDVWEGPLLDKAASMPSSGLRLRQLMVEALGFADREIKRADEMRAGSVLRKHGYERVVNWVHGRAVRLWRNGSGD